MVQPPPTATLVPRRGRGRPPKHGATHADLVSGVVGANGDDALPIPTFTSSLHFKVKGALARPRSPSPSSQSSSTTKDVAAVGGTTQPDASSTPSSTPANGVGTRMRSQRKSKMDAMAAITARSESPSEKVSQPSTSANGNKDSTPRLSPAEKRRASMPESVPLDMSSVKMPDRRIDPPRGAPRPFELEECPVYYPSPEEFKDPMKYIHSISDHAKQYGICKIIPPEGWNMSFVTDTKTFRFKTRLMRLNSIEASSRAKLNFLEQLYRFHQQQGPPGPVIPTINHKQLDLWLLRKEVHRKGGYDDVTINRQWGDISRALGYEQVTGVSSQLKNAYTRIILPFEQFSQHIRNSPAMAASLSPATPRLPKPVRMSGFNTTPSRNGRSSSRMSGSVGAVSQSPNKRRLSTPLSSSSSALSEPPEDIEVKPALTPDIKIEVSAPPDLRAGASTPSRVTPSPQLNSTLLPSLGPSEKPSHYVQGDTCEVCNDSDRGTEMLLCDGCDNGYHIFCLDPPLTAIPKGQWYCHICLFDTGGDYGFDEGEEHSLSSFQARDLAFRQSWFEAHPPPPSNWNNPRRTKIGSVEVSEDDVENEFWRLVQSPLDTVEVEYGADVHSTTHGSASPSLETHPLDPYSMNPWNMHNLPIVSDSLLRYVKSDISGMTVPWTYVGMMFSTFCWHNEDHYTYSVNFMHWGETKTWYGVPGDDAAKFEAAIKSEAPDLFDAQPDLLFQLVTLMSPARLRKAGVRVFACNQRPGEYVITFPQAYHAGFNHGFNLNEAVNFATPDWLDYGRLCVRRYQEHQKLPVFSHEELLITITQHSQTIKTAQWLLPALREMVNRELVQREDIRKEIPQLKEILDEQDREEEEQYQCAVCKGFCYLAQVTCECSKQVTCLEHWHSLCSCEASSRTLKHRFSDDQLKATLEGVSDKANRPLQWQKEFRATLLESSKPELSRLRRLLTEAEQMSMPLDEYLPLKDFVAKGDEWEARASVYLAPLPLPSFPKFFPAPGSPAKSNLPSMPNLTAYEIESLNECLEEADHLGFSSDVAERLKEASVWVDWWSERAKVMLKELEAASPTQPIDRHRWEQLFEDAHSHSIKLRLLPAVTRIIQRVRLIEELKGIEDMPLGLDQVRELRRLATYHGLPPEQEQAAKLAHKATLGEAWNSHAMKVLEQPIRSLDELDTLATPHPSVPVNPKLLVTIDSIRGRARELDAQARAILKPLYGHRTQIDEALKLVERASKEFTIPIMKVLDDAAMTAYRMERKCGEILQGTYQPPKALFEELREIRATVQATLWMFFMPQFIEVDSQLIRHDAWLERLPWYRTSDPAMQGQKIVDDVISNTRPSDDQAPTDPACTCICANPVKVSPERPSDAVQCDHCQAKFHAACIEGSCPFCDHHHWNGAIVKARSFHYHDLIPVATTAPKLTRDYSLAWQHLDTIMLSCDRLARSIDAFLAAVSEPNSQFNLAQAVAQCRHYLRKLYKIQFSIKPRPEIPAYGLTLAHLHRTLATSGLRADASVNGLGAGLPKKRTNRRPKLIFKIESAPVATDGTRCLCMGIQSGKHAVTCQACSQKYHNECVAYEEPAVPTQKPWRCPLCLIRKGKVYPYSALRVRYCEDTEPDLFVDHKTCLETYSGKLIRQRLPAPTEPTIIIELEKFIPGSNLSQEAPPPPEPSPPQAKPSRSGTARTRQSTNGSTASISEASVTSTGGSGNARAASATSQSASSSTTAQEANGKESTSGVKRKADGPSQTDVNPRRIKLVFRSEDKPAPSGTTSHPPGGEST